MTTQRLSDEQVEALRQRALYDAPIPDQAQADLAADLQAARLKLAEQGRKLEAWNAIDGHWGPQLEAKQEECLALQAEIIKFQAIAARTACPNCLGPLHPEEHCIECREQNQSLLAELEAANNELGTLRAGLRELRNGCHGSLPVVACHRCKRIDAILGGGAANREVADHA